MLDIILLIVFGKNIADIAEKKGLTKSNWIGIFVIGWFCTLVISGIVAAVLIAIYAGDVNVVLPTVIIAYASAIVWFICLRLYLMKKGGQKIQIDYEVDDHLITN